MTAGSVEFRGGFDLPAKAQKVGNFLLVQGWCLALGEQPFEVELSIDGEVVDRGLCVFPRYDIFREFQTEASYTSGFLARIRIQHLEAGVHDLQLSARAESGAWCVVADRKFRKVDGPGKQVGPMGGVGGNMVKADIGSRFLRYFVGRAGLADDHAVLDIGCGTGRMTVPLSRFLSPEGMYRGIDNVRWVVDYCKEHITARFPNFQFSHADIFNKMYNPQGKTQAAEYRFPFDDESFDLVFLTSVFTHMLAADTRHYLSEISRVLKPGGRCLATFFIINSEVQARIDQGRSRLTFEHDYQGCRVQNKEVPEAATAYSEDSLRRMFVEQGLTIREPIRFGRWSGIMTEVEGQDMVIARK